MMQNFRQFEAGPDPFGQTWLVQFRWLQNAITIRHADAVDVKFHLQCGDQVTEKVIALPHPSLVQMSARNGIEISDSLCMKIGALHLNRIIETGEDIEKILVTLEPSQVFDYAATLKPAGVSGGA